MKDWNGQRFDKEFMIEQHGDFYYYRDLYNGDHSKLFPRAINLIEKGEIVENLRYGANKGKNVTTPYIMANVCKWIVDTPTNFIVRAIGDVRTNFPADKEQAAASTKEETAMIEGTTTGIRHNTEVIDLQQETIDQITKDSRLNHKMNITQWQVDGGIVGVPALMNGQIKILIKEKNVYYPHDDGMGCDLIYELDQNDLEAKEGIEYVHVYSEVEVDNQLVTGHRLYERDKKGELSQVFDEEFIKERIGIDELVVVFPGRKRSMVSFLSYEPTFTDPNGKSALVGMEGRQDEVNWTFTRSGQTFERNGKPRISITKDTMQALKQRAIQTYGTDKIIDHRWLEVLEMDANGKSMEVHQVDISKIGDVSWVKDVIRTMLAETETSEAAVEFARTQTASNQSGTAKFYDLMTTLIKSERLMDEYIDFIQGCYEDALWIANRFNKNVKIERPLILTKDMLPTTKSESTTDNLAKLNAGAQSLEETVRQLHPDKSEEWITAELEKIGGDGTSQDSMSLQLGNMSAMNFMDNKDENGTPLNEDGTPVDANKE